MVRAAALRRPDLLESTVTETAERADGRGKPPKTISYFVNGESITTEERKLTVRVVLESAGFTPAVEYRLTRDDGNRRFDDYDEEISLRDGERFTATFLGPTPTS
jgi:hypothetical protein